MVYLINVAGQSVIAVNNMQSRAAFSCKTNAVFDRDNVIMPSVHDVIGISGASGVRSSYPDM